MDVSNPFVSIFIFFLFILLAAEWFTMYALVKEKLCKVEVSNYKNKYVCI